MANKYPRSSWRLRDTGNDALASKRGGRDRGQGRKAIFRSAMPKTPLRLPEAMREFLGNGSESLALRALLEWADQNQDQLLPDPGPSDPSMRTSYTLSERHIEIIKRLGKGSLVGGARRVIHMAMELNLDLRQLRPSQ